MDCSVKCSIERNSEKNFVVKTENFDGNNCTKNQYLYDNLKDVSDKIISVFSE